MKVWVSFFLVLAAAGCTIRTGQHFSQYRSSVGTSPDSQPTDEQKLLLQYHIWDGHAALESDRVVLVFHKLTPEQQRLFHFQDNQAGVQIAGPGVSSISITCATERAKVIFLSHYADGTNTLQLGEQSVRFTEGGRLLLAGDQTVDLSQGRKVVHLKRRKILVE